MKKYVEVGVISNIIIKREKRNSTYVSDEDFIKDKERIINIISRSINPKLFSIKVTTNCIILNTKESVINKNFNKLKKKFNNHKLFRFKDCNTNNKHITFRNIIEDYSFDEIDLDYNSQYAPISLETKVIGLFKSIDRIKFIDIDDLLVLLKLYSNHFMTNIKINDLLIYGIDV